MDIARLAYDISPVPIQNLFITLYGLRLRNLRYGQEFRSHCEFLATSEHFSPEQLRTVQNQRLIKLIDHAYQHVPFYRTRMDERGIRPNDVSVDNISRLLPILTKDELRSTPDDFRSRYYKKNDLTIIHTSGTTGTPLVITSTKSAVQENYAFFSRFLNWSGVAIGERSATFAGRIIIPPSQVRPPYWRRNRALNNVLFSSYHISDETIPLYIRELEHINPRFIDSYPSAIYAIARHINDHGVSHGIRPTAIVTSSETLQDFQRAAITAAFGCRVFDQFGSAEMATFLCQCSEGSYHVNPEYGLLEILDAQGKHVAPGEMGELVCTGFLNAAMPLIRYRIGDSAVFSTKKCNCGRQSPIVKSLLGRTDDLILTPEGRYVGRLDPAFKGLGSIRESQIIQESRTRVVVRIVRGQDYTEQVGLTLIAALRQRLGNMELILDYVDTIPRTSAGKFRSVISKITKR